MKARTEHGTRGMDSTESICTTGCDIQLTDSTKKHFGKLGDYVAEKEFKQPHTENFAFRVVRLDLTRQIL